MQIDPGSLDRKELYALITGIVVPRPIAFVSTVGKSGVATVAPFSFFNAVSSSPPVMAVSVGISRWGKKNTLLNVEETGEFVINIVNEGMLKQVGICGEHQKRDVSKIDLAKLTSLASTKVKPPRIAESPASMECTLDRLVDIEGATTVMFGKVVQVHVNDALIAGGTIDPRKVGALGRLSGTLYCRTTDFLSLE
ncbi:MAG: hypothetical protein A2Z34_00260 [Planctomycetes bacterium RBG_16_59_8]|nr:MAG: hypothetical protein A2Z34_00260 [Planctomycetes bacterium RBG_16_59_8]